MTADEKIKNKISTLIYPLQHSASGFEQDEKSQINLQSFVNFIDETLFDISLNINLETLDGITICNNRYAYKAALSNFDRGFETNEILTVSDGYVIGVAKQVNIVRNNEFKSHIFMNINYEDIPEIQTNSGKKWNDFYYTLLHECSHVEISNNFNKRFPNVLLKENHKNAMQHNHALINWVCWDEYVACKKSACADIDNDAILGYENILVECIKSVKLNIQSVLLNYKANNNKDELFSQFYTEYGNLLKYSSYCLGHIDCQEQDLSALKMLNHILKENEWFSIYLKKLHDVLRELFENNNKWSDRTHFQKISEIVEEMISEDVIFIFWGNILVARLKDEDLL